MRDIYDLMVKISSGRCRRSLRNDTELDGRKLRKYNTIDEAGIRENSELVLRTETKKRGGDFVDDDDEDEDGDDILSGGERIRAKHASYESEYEFEYEDPSSSSSVSSSGSDVDKATSSEIFQSLQYVFFAHIFPYPFGVCRHIQT